MAAPIELNLIVAATRTMGIGFAGGMPWNIKAELKYFRRVTSRRPANAGPNAMNVVIMGRKTWDSIPPKFRPLSDRLNIIISRSASKPDTSSPRENPVRCPSLSDALAFLQARSALGEVGKVFVIGGGQIYASALELPQTRRVLLTRIQNEYECDTHFPLKLAGVEEGESAPGWSRCGQEALSEWAGEEVPAGNQEEGNTKYEFQMWQKE